MPEVVHLWQGTNSTHVTEPVDTLFARLLPPQIFGVFEKVSFPWNTQKYENVGLGYFHKHLQNIQGVFFSLVPPLKVLSTKKLIKARLGVSRPIYVDVDSPNLGFPYFNFLGGVPVRKNTLYNTQ